MPHSRPDIPSWEQWDRAHRRDCRLVAIGNADAVIGWAALSQVSARAVYAGVAEVSVYISAQSRGRGIGKLLLSKLSQQSEACGIWTLQAGIFPENQASIALHTSCGFRQVGTRQRLGCLHGQWRDVILFERRSNMTGR